MIIFLWQLSSIIGHPGVVESKFKKSREKFSPKTSTASHAVYNHVRSTTPFPVNVEPIKITHKDVIDRKSIYSAHFDSSNAKLSGSGMLFAVNTKGITSPPQIMAAGWLD